MWCDVMQANSIISLNSSVSVWLSFGFDDVIFKQFLKAVNLLFSMVYILSGRPLTHARPIYFTCIMAP
jgi:hypothetical protein